MRAAGAGGSLGGREPAANAAIARTRSPYRPTRRGTALRCRATGSRVAARGRLTARARSPAATCRMAAVTRCTRVRHTAVRGTARPGSAAVTLSAAARRAAAIRLGLSTCRRRAPGRRRTARVPAEWILRLFRVVIAARGQRRSTKYEHGIKLVNHRGFSFKVRRRRRILGIRCAASAVSRASAVSHALD
jgi:hypothetical protein